MKLLDNSVVPRTGLPSPRDHSCHIALGVAAAVVLLLPMAALAAPVFFATDCLPPLGSEYTGSFHQQYAAGLIDLRNPIHDHFTHCDPPPPPPGGNTTHSFDSRIRMEISTDGGATYQPHQALAQATVSVHNSGPDGTGGTLYDTEMLQLDISGGTLPPGVRIRESPTLQSTGKTTIDPAQGGFMIDSFFDIFTELSVDGGQTWMPSEGPPGHMVMDLPQATPTHQQTWGAVKLLYR